MSHYLCVGKVVYLTENSRKFRLECKWNTLFWFVPLENCQDERKFWKGSPVFLVGTFQIENSCSIRACQALRVNPEILSKW